MLAGLAFHHRRFYHLANLIRAPDLIPFVSRWLRGNGRTTRSGRMDEQWNDTFMNIIVRRRRRLNNTSRLKRDLSALSGLFPNSFAIFRCDIPLHYTGIYV